MGSGEGNKKGSHVASESISSENSLSFAGLVCIHDQQQPKPYVPNHDDKFIWVSKTDPDFEFDIHTKNNSSSATSVKKSKAQQEVATLFQPNSSPIISLSTLLGIGDHNNMSNGHTEVVIRKGRKHAKKKGSVKRTSFGKKVCKSFLAPCQQCKAIQPSAVKEQSSVPPEKSKLLT